MAKKSTKEGAAIPDLIFTMAMTFFRMRTIGQRGGAVTSWGGGTWGFLRTVVQMGPLTVPEIARIRPVARQHMQRMADEAVADGLVEFIDNPAHKRSKLIRITGKGLKEHDRLKARMVELGTEWADGLTLEDIETTVRTLAHLRDKAE
jgi:DNA-binding MarR family transcriptional regulator